MLRRVRRRGVSGACDGDCPRAVMAAFQQFWRENSGADRDIMGYRESVPIFEKLAETTWDEKIYARDVSIGGKTIHLIGL